LTPHNGKDADFPCGTMAKDEPKASPRNRARARKQLEQRRAQLQQLSDNPNLRADVRGDVDSALRAVPKLRLIWGVTRRF